MLTPDRYERVRELFLAARDQNAEDRVEYLKRVCGDDELLLEEIESLLDNDDQSGTFLQTPALGDRFAVPGPEWAAQDAKHSVPDRIGQYRILGVLGEGGMGVVYSAEQEKPRRPVALKVIKSISPATRALQRFEFEAHVLGRLRHAGIAQIYEAGTAQIGSDGRVSQPFFAMEMVEGQPLTEYAESSKLGVRARLELIAKVCDAVQHAHQNGVIHRDLKPANILVDAAGQPKVLDFGVARATDLDVQITTMRTDVGQLVGTLQYMSPEQVSGDPTSIDTRCDVYAIGVISYETLTGQLPHRLAGKSIAEAARMITEETPTRLSVVDHQLRGDIETIVSKALTPDREQRYSSASALAADIRRYLRDEPISARPASTIYHLKKFAKRNKLLVGATCALVVALVFGLAQSLRAQSIARQRLVDIQREVLKTQAINDFFIDMMASPDPGKDGRDIKVVDVLNRAAANIEGKFTDQPVIASSLQGTIGTTYIGLGLYAEAEPHLRLALARANESSGEISNDAAVAMSNLASALQKQNKLEEAQELLRSAYEMRRREVGENDPDTLKSLTDLTAVISDLGDMAEAARLGKHALDSLRRVAGNDDQRTLVAVTNLGLWYLKMERIEEAVPLLREAVDGLRTVAGPEHPDTLASMTNLSSALEAIEEHDEAITIQEHILEIRRRGLGNDHPSTLQTVNNLADTLRVNGRHDAAEPLFRESYEGFRARLGDKHPQTLIAQNNLAFCLMQLDRHTAAEPHYAEIIARLPEALPPGHWVGGVFSRNYGICLTELEKYETAESQLLPAFDTLQGHFGDDHEHVNKTRVALATLYKNWGKPEKAGPFQATDSTGE